MRGVRGDLQRDAIAVWPAQTAPHSTGAKLGLESPEAGSAPPPWVARVEDAEALLALLDAPPSGLEWIEVPGLLEDLPLWRSVAQKTDATCLDVVMQDPAAEFSRLYRLVDVSSTRSLGVTIPVRPGFLKALKLAASIGLPVRLLPGQPDKVVLAELDEALSFYLHDPMLDAPVEFFHSVLSYFHGYPCSDLWTMLQEDPGAFPRYDEKGQVRVPRSVAVFSEMDTAATPANFVERHVQHLLDSGAECALCPWLGICQGYFKWPDENYSCAAGIIPLFDRLRQTAEEMQEALASAEEQGWVGEREVEQEEELEREQGYAAAGGMQAGRPKGGRSAPDPWDGRSRGESAESPILHQEQAASSSPQADTAHGHVHSSGAPASQGTGTFLSPLSGKPEPSLAQGAPAPQGSGALLP